jgi:hypothetical protein
MQGESSSFRIVARSRVRPLALLGVEFVSVLLQLERNAFQRNLSENSPIRTQVWLGLLVLDNIHLDGKE